MRFYTEQHQHYCGIDLHARTHLGNALYMRAIHGAKAKNDRIDSLKTASMHPSLMPSLIASAATRGDWTPPPAPGGKNHGTATRCLCPSPEPGDNWPPLQESPHPLIRAPRGNGCISGSREGHPLLAPSPPSHGAATAEPHRRCLVQSPFDSAPISEMKSESRGARGAFTRRTAPQRVWG